MSYIIKHSNLDSKTLYEIQTHRSYYDHNYVKTVEHPILTIKRITLPYHEHNRYELIWHIPNGNFKALKSWHSSESDLWQTLLSDDMLEWMRPIKKPEFDKIHISGSKKKITFYSNDKYITFLGHLETTPKFVEKMILYAYYGPLIEHCLKLNKSFNGDVSAELWETWSQQLHQLDNAHVTESLLDVTPMHVAFLNDIQPDVDLML